MAGKQQGLAVVLVNLGTPENPTASGIRAFLKQFLWDPRVVEISRPLWWLILNLAILPFRSPKVAILYQRLWQEYGDSPLRIISKKQQAALQQAVDNDPELKNIVVLQAMSYGEPSLSSVLDDIECRGIGHILFLPLYPQYSATTTASVYDQLGEIFRQRRNIPDYRIIKEYYAEPGYQSALSESVSAYWQKKAKADVLLISFHGIPQQNVDKGDPYYQQCLSTAATLVQALGLEDEQWRISFQSRVGRAMWLQPYTNEVLQDLGSKGIKRVDVVCPSFSVDCLETLEEIAVENKIVFLGAGGETLNLIPCLNAQPLHIEMMKTLVRNNLGGFC